MKSTRYAQTLAIYIAIANCFLGVATMFGNNAAEDAARQSIEAANLYAWYQAKTTRMYITKDEGERSRLKKERETLKVQADDTSQARDRSLKADMHFDYSIAVMQAAIAIAAVDILLCMVWPFILSFLFFSCASVIAGLGFRYLDFVI